MRAINAVAAEGLLNTEGVGFLLISSLSSIPFELPGFTSFMDSPSKKTTFWSAIVRGDVKKKNARVTWKSDIHRMIANAETIAMIERDKEW